MDLYLGDHVIVIDEDLNGEVVSISNERVVICCEDGFEYTYRKDELLKVGAEGEIEFVRRKFEVSDNQEEFKEIKLSNTSLIELKGKKPTIDLHIEELAPSHQFNNLHEILDFQLNHVRQVLLVAATKRIRQLIFVHGVGKGVLRKELRMMLSSNYPSIEFFDGSYNEYGAGATEIIIHQFSAIH